MSNHRAPESDRREFIDKMIHEEKKHEESMGRKSDERKIEKTWKDLAVEEDKKRGLY